MTDANNTLYYDENDETQSRLMRFCSLSANVIYERIVVRNYRALCGDSIYKMASVYQGTHIRKMRLNVLVSCISINLACRDATASLDIILFLSFIF